MDIYGFYAGKVFDAYKYMGAHIENDQVVFRTYAPRSRVELIGEFNNWSGTEMYRVEDNKFFECRVSNLKWECYISIGFILMMGNVLIIVIHMDLAWN